MVDYTKYVHEFTDDQGRTRYAVAEYIEANGQYIRTFDKGERRLTGGSAEFARKPGGVQNYADRRRALRRARYLYRDREEWADELAELKRDVIWDSQMTLYRDSFATQAAYLREFRECNRHYGFKARVEGGWRFFEFEDDYLTWKRQK